MDQLPNEVLFKIMSYLNIYDLTNFCSANRNNDFLKDGLLNRSVDFSRGFTLPSLNLYSFITTHLNYTSIRSLNINYLYWIPVTELRKVLAQLENLEILYAIDTDLGLEAEDIIGYAKLRKLAITVKRAPVNPSTSIEVSKNLKALQSLCIKLLQKSNVYYLYQFFEGIQHLEELWLLSHDDATFQSVDYYDIINMLRKLKKIVIKSKTPGPYLNLEDHKLFKTFECRKNGSASELIFEKINKPADLTSAVNTQETVVEEALRFLETSLHDLPCGPVESKKIYLKECVSRIYFDELNFCHPIILCNSKYIDAALQILASENSSKLRRLRFRSCLFETPQVEKPAESPLGSKRSKETTQKTSTNHPFWAIAENLRNLRELEIDSCPVCNGGLMAYFSLQTFKNLRKLTVEVPLPMDGLFLKEVFIKCPNLESLNVTCAVQNEEFISNLYHNIKHALNLKDFRLETKKIVMENLLNSLNENVKLSRFVVKCDRLKFASAAAETESSSTFVRNHPQLILFVVVSRDLKNIFKEIKDTFKAEKPNKVFWTSREIDQQILSTFPNSVHNDIILNRTNVSVINTDQF